VKKALSYAAIAIILGTVTMLAPTYLPAYSNEKAIPMRTPKYCPEERLEGAIVNATLEARAEALERTLCPSNLSSAGLMLIPSFFLALGVSLYLKKRMF